MKQVIVVTGASSGFRFACGTGMAKAGHVVYAACATLRFAIRGGARGAKFAAKNKADLRTVVD